jgi:FeS assembly SUF system protein
LPVISGAVDRLRRSPEPAPDRPTPVDDAPSPLKDSVVQVLRTIYDPEIPVSIWDLGLIYGITTTEDGTVNIRMTLTAPACPVAESLPGVVQQRIEALPGVSSAKVEVVWDPPWDRSRMSEAAKLELGLL